jgi:GT2 family glycosyltransferase
LAETTPSNIVVLGMHRSGTSMITSVLEASGLFAGEPEELLAPQPDNPLGFWERSDVMALNDRLLADQGRSWYLPTSRQPGAVTQTKEATDAVRREMASVAGKLREPWVLKDPRFAMTWAQWEEVLHPALFLFVYRNPIAVARSLEKRNGISLDFGMALWEAYNRQLLEFLSGRPCVAVSYDRFCEAPQPTLAALEERLGSHGVTLDAWDGQRFDAALNHSHQVALDELLTSAQLALHRYCDSFTERGVLDGGMPQASPNLDARLASFSAQYEQQLRSAAAGVRLELELADVNRQLDAHNKQLLAQKALLETRDEQLEKAVRSADEFQQSLAANQRELASNQRELASNQRALASNQRALASKERALVEETAKSGYLYDELSRAYLRLSEYSESRLGQLEKVLARSIGYLTFRRGGTALDEVTMRARAYLEEQNMTPSSQTGTSRLSLLSKIIRFAVTHPHGTLRNLNVRQLKRLVGQFGSLNSADLTRWVEARFPEEAKRESLEAPELNEALDELEFEFPSWDTPLVSIIVPVFNQYRMTVNCLESLRQHTDGVAYEVILGDDASTDLTRSIEQRIRGMALVRAETNGGFIRNCNAAADVARGQVLVFLNNDTAVTDGWLDAMLGVLSADESVGVVGPKLLFGAGKLQEAGGIIWQDASGWNYGRTDDPDAVEYNYQREVDYVSGACLMIRSSLWRQTSGFDEHFVPAYYEDVDVCFAVRELGYRVVYQPAATVFHFEGASNGTDTSQGIKKHQLVNQRKFREKWAAVLDRDHFPNGEQVFAARDRSRRKRTVVVVDHYVPFFDKDAGSRSVFQYLQLMVEMGFNVKFIGANFFPHQPYTDALQQMGIEVLVGEKAASGISRWLVGNAEHIHAVYLNRPHVAEQFLDDIDKMVPRPTVAFWGCDLHYLRTEREFAVTGDAKQEALAADWKTREYRIFDRVDCVYYPSDVEVAEIHAHRSDLNARVLPLYVMDQVQVPAYDAAGRAGILFVGGFGHPPNLDGISWFIEAILPLVRRAHPDVVLHIVGSNTPESIKAMDGEAIRVHGFVSDETLEQIYLQVRLAVIPLRFGAGVKGKVVEAIQRGVPAVTTSIGAEGLPDAESVLAVADDEASFADEIIRVLDGESERLGSYQDYLDRNFSRQTAEEILSSDLGSPHIPDQPVA